MRAHVDLKRETALVLHVEVPVGLGDGGSVEEAALADVRVRCGEKECRVERRNSRGKGKREADFWVRPVSVD